MILASEFYRTDVSDDSRPAGSEDPWPDEPDDPFAEKYERRFKRDESDLVPDPPDPDEIPPDVHRTFWSLVGAINVALLAGSLGIMLIGFRGEWLTGGALVAGGLVALGWSVYRYRAFKRREGEAMSDGTEHTGRAAEGDAHPDHHPDRKE